MSAPVDPSGDAYANPGKRPLEHSPTQAQQPGTSLFASGNGARTIYSNGKSAFGTPTPGGYEGGVEQDHYAQGAVYAGPRTTGMGRQASGNGADAFQSQQSVMTPMSPHDMPRKRLRRGGPGGDDATDEGPGSFTSGLQSRLEGVHVESGPPSGAASPYGGSGSASMAPTPSYGSQPGDPSAQQHQPMHPGTPPVNPRLVPSPAPPAQNGSHDPAFLAFRQQAGTNFPPDKIWQAWQQGGGDTMRALQVLVNAKPASPAGFSPASSYSAVNPALAPPPNAQQYATPQQQQQMQLAAAQRQVPVGHPQQGMARPSVLQGTPNSGYTPQQLAALQQQRMMQGGGQPGSPMVGAQGMMGGQGGVAYGAAPGQPGGYPAQGVQRGMQMTPQQAQLAAQQRQMHMAQAQAAQAQGPTQAGFTFPHAEIGVAKMTEAHVTHYYQLQEGYKRGRISPEEYKQLMQYVTVLRGYYSTPEGRMHAVGRQPQYPPGAGASYHPQAYSQQGVYAPRPGAPPHMMPQQPQQVRPKQQVPKHQAPLTSGTILARQLALAGGGGSTKKKPVKKIKTYNSDTDDDGGDYDSAGSGDEYGSRENPAQVAKKEAIAVEFFNDCTREQLMELAGCNATQATLTMKLRPFNSANDFRTRTRKQKGVGNNMMDTYLDVVSGMSEVDKVLNECEQIGRELASVMSIWASGAAASSTSDATRPGAASTANDVGLDLVAISEETIVTRVDTSQDPRVREAFKDYIRRQPAGVPENITLKDYQMLGVNWLNLLYKRGTSCILADEMGLGKTAQVIALLAHLKANNPQEGPHLVIVPSSTLDNWMREFSVFAPNLVVMSYYGSQGERAEIRHELRKMEELDVVVTTYNIATGSPDDQKFLKRKMDFKVCVFDEGHQLKNSDSKKYKDLMQIRADWRLLLTGTPLQNNLQELVSLLSFILPEQFRDANESLRAIFKVQPGSQTNLLSRERINRAKKMMTPFVLRRKKAQVLKDLPQKFERIEYCPMTDMQKQVYDEAVQRSRRALTGAGEDEIEEMGEQDDDEGVDEAPEDAGAKPKRANKRSKPAVAHTKTGNKADTTSSAHVLTDLRKASNHPMLFRRLYDVKTLRKMAADCLKEEEFLDRNKDLIFEDMEVMTDFELHRFCQGYKHLEKYCLTDNEWMSAGKVQKLQELLPPMQKNGDRVLIFSQFVQVLDLLEVVLDTMEIKYLKLTGQTQVADRQALVDAFNQNEDITVFLLSTRAGGLGLNLTAANTVIFYDCDYNPHNDKQAEDRAYRIGQTRDVNIVRLVTKDSLDEAMLQLANTKLKLDSEVSGGAGANNAPGATSEVSAEEDQATTAKVKRSLLAGLKSTYEREAEQAKKEEDAPPKTESVA
ncbi:hypothetical protein JCM10207_007278 [Rhodosporidiobolus poonsookiae]